MSERTFTAVIHTEEDLFVAYCPEVGTVSHGCTVEEAVANLKEAKEIYRGELPPSEEETALKSEGFGLKHYGIVSSAGCHTGLSIASDGILSSKVKAIERGMSQEQNCPPVR